MVFLGLLAFLTFNLTRIAFKTVILAYAIFVRPWLSMGKRAIHWSLFYTSTILLFNLQRIRSALIGPNFRRRATSSDGRALALHARGTEIDTQAVQKCKLSVLSLLTSEYGSMLKVDIKIGCRDCRVEKLILCFCWGRYSEGDFSARRETRSRTCVLYRDSSDAQDESHSTLDPCAKRKMWKAESV